MDSETRELRALEAEVAALQRECRMLQNAGEKASGAWKSFQKISQSDSEEWESLKDLRSQLEHLRSEHSFLSKLTGFNIRNYSKMEDIVNTEETEKDTKKVLQKHRLSGNCNMVTFQLEFEVLEMETKEKKSSIITDLSIIMEPTEYSELSEFASRAEEKRDLLMFFRSLHFFVEWCEYRENTFKHFKTHSLSISSQERAGLQETTTKHDQTRNLEAGTYAEAIEGCCLLDWFPWLTQLALL
ncbi:centromere protein P isoform X1 [Mus musculus]|nr:centromere protein P isoform X1 [Mus musculus]EDL41078.1 centromere protein P, isoform CRA_a [Mus musculus]